MSRSIAMLALTIVLACKVQVPSKACVEVMLGACVDRPSPRAFAAPSARCERGRARKLDLGADGACATTRETRDLARTTGVFVDENDAIECESKSDELVAAMRTGKIGCVALEPASPPSCPLHTVHEGDACSPLEERSGVIDLGRWARAAAELACSRAARSTVAVGAPETELEVEISAVVPNNDPTQGFVRIRARRGLVPSEELERIGRDLDDALRRLEPNGAGTASASEANGVASCRISMRRPISVP